MRWKWLNRMLYKTLTHSMQPLTNQLWKLSNMINMVDPVFFPNLHGKFKEIPLIV